MLRQDTIIRIVSDIKGVRALLNETIDKFRNYLRKISHYNEALALMQWDLRTGAPKKGHPLRAESMGTISGKIFEMSTSPEMESFLAELSDPAVYGQLDDVNRALVRVVKREFERSKKIPADRFEAYVILASQAESVWEDAKETSDFSVFEPYLEKIVAMKQEFIDYWGYDDNKYDTLLDQYEPGLTVQKVDQIFKDLRRETVELVKAITERGRQVDLAPFSRPFSIEKQKELSALLLKRMGYDFTAGRIDETVHPFQTTINRYDARVTTHYYEKDFLSAIFSTIHEGGHALYEQGVSPKLIGTPLSGGTSMGIHESQSRFWENIVGRSFEFWEYNYSDLIKLFKGQLSDVPLSDFYRAINDVQPSLVRIEADEVTYNLHIMIRYEIEKGLINGDLKVADLPLIWNEKMNDYLGVTPPDDAHGVLQDVHWSGGDFGYFPSYSLGNIYSAQFAHKMAEEIPDLKERIRGGEFTVIKNWLNEKIHVYGATLEPAEILKRVTGEEIDSKYLITYFKEKYSALYRL
jgi:carboxypeptidase Taq